MILKKIYEEATKTQKVWYDSSMIIYSEMVESDDTNSGMLYITFNNGSIYVYKNVSFDDYLVFIGGGSDASQGKTLNKIIKSKYESEKVGIANITEIKNELNKIQENEDFKSITYFISGPTDISPIEFEFNYMPLINFALQKTQNAHFILSDEEGVSLMAQNYLLDVLSINESNLTVYHVGDTHGTLNEKVINIIGGFTSIEERNKEMTNNSFEDIALVKNINELSYTAKNILRRYLLKSLSQ